MARNLQVLDDVFGDWIYKQKPGYKGEKIGGTNSDPNKNRTRLHGGVSQRPLALRRTGRLAERRAYRARARAC